MMGKHTEGPWVFGGNCGCRTILTEGDTEKCDPDGKHKKRGVIVAMMGGARDQKANAHLISAAPDVLEALEEMINYACESCDGVLCPPDRPRQGNGPCIQVQKALAAIQKAKGATHER